MMGVKNTTDFLEKSTWKLAIALIVLILASSLFIGNDDRSSSQQPNKTESGI